MEEGIIMKKRLLALLMGAVFILGGCQSSEESASSSAASASTSAETAENTELEDFTIVLDWYPNAVHSYIYTAIEKGYYAEEGLNVIVQFPSNTTDPITLTAAGKADAGIYYMHDTILANARNDVPVKVIGAIIQEPVDIFLSLKESGITGAEGLIGKTLGHGGTELSETITKYLVEQAGGSIDDVNMIDVGFDLMSSLTTGNVDVTYGCVVNHEVPQMEEYGFEVNYFFPNEYGVPDYYGHVLVTGETQLAEEKDKLAAFLRASAKGFEDMKNNPDEALSILLNNQNEENFPLSEDVEKKSVEILLPMMEHDDAPFLSQKEEVWQKGIDWLTECGVIEEGSVTPSDVMEVIEY